ncbi:hypothetical protein A3L04_00520 [Thermococcus chitonophagus]|uniref:Lipoprotein n=1 Tax=Thermococcus chitonophagus TaxID=54262 RepID=A0A160VPX5_9EURY|nr:hypothetical protein [Thermococcus chitonophagus]ASJ15665.1 hypothetical protein A3L04_00520 [Thermococcus chitonophagus]CUX76873.1 hypothetical protein CHITON_0094 [Thermococcus chitonophagus]
MKVKWLLIFVLASIVVLSGCIEEKSSTTATKSENPKNIRAELLSVLDNETNFGATWEIKLFNKTSYLALSTGKAVVTPKRVLTYRESKSMGDTNWSSKSIIIWENGTGTLFVEMRIGNTTQPYKSTKEFNFTVAKRIAYPYGEIMFALSDKLKFNETKQEVKCNGECILHVLRKFGYDEMGDITTGPWTIKYIEANITYDPNTKKIKEASIYLETSRGDREILKCSFIRENLAELEKELEEKYLEFGSRKFSG